MGLLLVGCAFAQKANQQAQVPTFQEAMGKYFLVGAAVNTQLADGSDPAAEALVKTQFNQVVAENCMKGEVNHPEVNRFDFTDGDKLADWAEKNGKTLIGHCLVWHSQPPKWMFTDEKGNLVSREVLIGRMYNHIMTVVTHYKGRVKGWDVVNEAIEDDGHLIIRLLVPSTSTWLSSLPMRQTRMWNFTSMITPWQSPLSVRLIASFFVI